MKFLFADETKGVVLCRYVWRVTGMGCVLLISGCAVGPNYKAPPPPNVSGYTAGPLSPTVSAQIPGGDTQTFIPGKDIPGEWWTLFHSPELNQLIAEGLKDSPTLQAAQAALREARENVYAEEGSFFPTVTGDGTAERQKYSSAEFGSAGGFSTSSSAYNLYDASLSLSYTLDVFGGTRRQVESLIAERDYEAYELEASYLSLTANIVTSAITEASLRAQIKATQEIIASLTTQVDILRKQFNLGGVSRGDVLTEESNLRQEQATLPPLQLQLAQTRNELAAYVGRLPSEQIIEKFDLDKLRLPRELPVSLPSQLVAQRPDIQASAAELHQASANIGVAVANRLPQITLSGSLGSEALQATSLFTPGTGLWSIASEISQPIFDGGTLLHKQKSSEAAFDEAAAQYRGTVVTSFQDVANVLSALDSDAKALQADLEAEQSSAESLKISTGQYKVGAVTYVTVLSAQQTYQTAVIALVKARATRYSDTAALFQALGGGWWHRNDIHTQPSFIENPL
jgi:NodT family efflux transporter outer membrane factor (OMF) lipoprotein